MSGQKKREGYHGETEQFDTISIGQTNIISLVKHVVQGTPYQSNGTLGSSEKVTVEEFKKWYEKNKALPGLGQAMNDLIRTMDAGYTPEQANTKKKYDGKSDIIAYLSDMTGDGKVDTVAVDKDDKTRVSYLQETEVEQLLKAASSDKKLSSVINSALALA